MSIIHHASTTMAGGAGSAGTVNLTTGTASATSAFFSQGGWYFNSDGTVDRFTTQGGQVQWQSSTDWIFPRTGFLNSDYQVRFQKTSGGATFTSGSNTRDTWHTLSSNRLFILEDNSTTNNFCIADIRHRTNGALNTQLSLDDNAACMATTFMNVYLEVTGGGGGGGGGCFTGGMLVLMADGTEKPIKDIMAGEEVMSYNEYTGETEAARVNDIMVPRICDIYEVQLNNGKTIETTIEHPFRTVNGEWAAIDTEATYTCRNGVVLTTMADKPLREGAMLHGINGTAKVKGIVKTGRKETVYHLSYVEKNHNFFVEGVCVHNIGDTINVK